MEEEIKAVKAEMKVAKLEREILMKKCFKDELPKEEKKYISELPYIEPPMIYVPVFKMPVLSCKTR